MINAITLSGTTVGLQDRQVRLAMEKAHEFAGRFWFRRFADLHFLPSAVARYGYERRRAKTQRRKEQLAKRGLVVEDGRSPLVWSGLMKREYLRTPIIKATDEYVRMTMIAPNYVHARGKRMYRELTAITPGEEEQINRETQRVYDSATATARRMNARIQFRNTWKGT